MEFAFVSVFLMLLLFGIIEMGRLLFAYSVVSNAAQEGTRYAITRPRDLMNRSAAATRIAMGTAVPTQLVVPDGSCNIYDNARSEVWGVSRSDIVLNVTYENASATPLAASSLNNVEDSDNYYEKVARQGNRVTVEASYKFNFIVPLIGQFAPNGIDVKMSAARSILNNGEGSFSCNVNYEPAPVPPTATNTVAPTNTLTAPEASATANAAASSTQAANAAATSTQLANAAASATQAAMAVTFTPTPTASRTRTSTTVPTATQTPTNTATPTPTPENRLFFSSIDVYKANGNNKGLDVVVYVTDQKGQYVSDAVITFTGSSLVGQNYTGILPSVGGGRYQICDWKMYSGGAGDVTVTVKATKASHQEANGSATNQTGAFCSTTPTSTSTPTRTPTSTNTATPTNTATYTPTNTPTPNPSITGTPTGTPTSPPTLTPRPSATATPAACPYTVTVNAYKAPTNARAYVRVQVMDALNRKVAGSQVSVRIRGEVRRGQTDSAGNLCLVFNKHLGNSVDGDVSVSGPQCYVFNQPFTTSTSGVPCQ